MKTSTGVFGAGTQQSNSLVAAELKHPEISSVLIQQYPRYALTYLLERTGRHANVEVAGDKSFEWKVLGRTGVKAVIDARFTTIPVSSVAAAPSVVFEQAELAKFDVVMDSAGNVGQVTAELGATATLGADGSAGGTGDDLDGTGFGYTISFSNGHAPLVAGGTVGRIGSAFGEGSAGLDVSEGTNYPDTYKNWLTINRRKISITGGALTDVTWIENNGSKLWYFTAEKLFTDEFMYQLELQRWFGKTNYSATEASGYNANDSALMGDGILAQISGSVAQDYTGGLTEDKLALFIAELSRNAKSPEGNEWVVFTGTEGRYQFHKAMKEISVGAAGATGGTMQSMKTGSDVSLGVNYTSYNVLGNKMTVAYCPVFDDANAHGAAAGASGNMSGKMVFLDFSSVDGVPNVQLVAKGADGLNRNYIKKYIPGMISPYDQKSMLAANGDDAFVCQIMSESGIIVRNPLSCGVLSKAD
jgi:hypothetical protein